MDANQDIVLLPELRLRNLSHFKRVRRAVSCLIAVSMASSQQEFVPDRVPGTQYETCHTLASIEYCVPEIQDHEQHPVTSPTSLHASMP